MHIAVIVAIWGREGKNEVQNECLNKEGIKWPLIINLKKILTIFVTILRQIHQITATVSVSTLRYG